MRFPIHAGLRLRLLRPVQWEAGTVPAGSVGTVYVRTLPSEAKIHALFFQDRLPLGKFDWICFGLPPRIDSETYEVV